ncbi:helix-turn-helix domain-containing protein [Halobacterium salinarum]|uniref:helix-turn-helix domain-containing protein n=1 Tax=Halobacterium salinarum TaxID=2242 RepID=UPI001F226024|nr:helix-turn-helix domain-containing protein [Halobacterium salinarum]MCF2237773.1 helix-turn-helix domain-containing protein [Halobacterium salinarum]MDL0140554.1 helix-turn-helix domain-containing protein [Halobacterium salinarum]
MRDVTLRVRNHGAPASDVSADYPAVTVRAVSSLPGSGGDRSRILAVRGPGDHVQGFLDTVAAADPVRSVDAWSGRDADHVFVAVTHDTTDWRSVTAHLADHGIHHRGGSVVRAGWEHWTLYLPDGDPDPTEAVAAIEAAGSDAELVGAASVEAGAGGEHFAVSRMLDALTDRQREVLALATRMGYYDEAATVRVADIADEIGLADTTTWEHLSRAEETVMAEVGAHLAARGH